jgi:hypothetical protein
MGEHAIWILFKFEMLVEYMLYYSRLSPTLQTTQINGPTSSYPVNNVFTPDLLLFKIF